MRHLMSDELSLRRYQWNMVVEAKEIKANLVACAHNYNPIIPDHYYESWNSMTFRNAKCCDNPQLSDYFIKLLPRFAETYLMFDNDNNICVKDDMWNEWQLIIREFSPSVMKVLFLYMKSNNGQILDVDPIVAKNFKYTCLPDINDTFIKHRRSSFSDLHVHAGSSLEADIIWLHLLHDANFFIQNENKWREDFKNHGIVKSRMDLYKLSIIGRNLIDKINSMTNHEPPADKNENELLWKINNSKKGSTVVSIWAHNNTLLQEEAKLLLKALKEIRKISHLDILLHYYLLVKGIFRIFLIVQSSQFGLYQFNRILHAPFRGATMEYLHESLLQMTGNDLHGARYIELRVPAAHLKEIDTITKSVRKMHTLQSETKTPIGLVCHFIKGNNIESQYRIIESNIQRISGIDVAGCDFKANPGEFSKVFNRLRSNKYGKHLCYTYHAGEDFFHILDGLRIIYEAAVFLELGEKDRIGHASAAGIDPELWAANLGYKLPTPLGKYFDNLLFVAYLYFIENKRISFSVSTKRKFLKRFKELSRLLDVSIRSKGDLVEWWIKRKDKPKEYESSETYKKVIIVDCFEIFSYDEIVKIQKETLKILKNKGVAIETTPTSNVTIGHHHSFRTYHLLTWLKWKQNGDDIPAIVLGSDETGVFSTNISNEYANIFDLIRRDENFDNPEHIIMDIMNSSNARIFQNINHFGIF